MLLQEIFNDIVDFDNIGPDRYSFKINDLIYEVDFREDSLPKDTQIKLDREENIFGTEVEFTMKTKNSTKRDLKFGITNTGNSIKVFSTVLTIIEKYMNKEKPEFFFFTAEEKSRQKLYDRLSKRINSSSTDYKLYDTVLSNNGKAYTFKKN